MKKQLSKLVSTIFILLTLIFMMSGCVRNNGNKNGTTIVCTIFPIYDWVCQMTEGVDDIQVILLSENGADMHSFQPTVKDVVTIADCDYFIYIGGESEEWIDDCLSQSPNPNRIDIKLMDVLEGNVVFESDEGIIQGEDEEEEEPETDEHIWLSLSRSIKCIEYISEEISKDLEDSNKLNENTSIYTKELLELDEEYREYFDNNDRQLIVLDRFPFSYLCSDYDVDYLALFPGCSTDSNASFKTVIVTSDILNDSEEACVYITENGDETLAKTIIEQSGKNVQYRILDSIQTVSLAKAREDNVSYLSIMKNNLKILKEE